MNYKILCRNCNTTVARTPNKICVKCSYPKWGYSDNELSIINSVKKPTFHKLTCRNCRKTVAKTPNKICVSCKIPNWGYTDFEVSNGLFTIEKQFIGKPKINENKKKGSVSRIIFSGLILLCLFSGIGGLVFFYPEKTIVEETEKDEFQTEAENDKEYAFEIDDIQKAVVMIKAGSGTGTGFLISPTDILTASHVVEDYKTVNIEFTESSPRIKKRGKVIHKGKTENATGFDFFLHDYALIEIPKVTQIKPLKLGNSDTSEVLTKVFTVGHSLGGPVLSLTDGTISRLNYGNDRLDLFTHTIGINPGNSGGPMLMEETKEVIGIVVGTRAPLLTAQGIIIPQGENIAVKVSNILRNINTFDIEN